MVNSISKQLGKRIRELRIVKGFKQGQFADMLNMERSNFTRIESGKQRPNDDNISKIAELLGVEVYELYNFNHLQSSLKLKNFIKKELNSMSEKEIQYIYKTVQNIKFLRQK